MVSSSRKSTPESTEMLLHPWFYCLSSSDTVTDIAFTHGKSTSSQNNFTPSSRMESSSTIFTPGSSDNSVATNLASTSLQQTQMLSSPELVSTTRGLVTCRSVPCQNGGICRESLVSEVVTYRCDCPFRFGGNFCEQELTIFFPSFDGEAYLEHAPIGFAGYPTNEVFVTLVSRSNSGLILFSESIPTSSSDDYFYLYLSDWKVTAEISCGFGQILRVQSEVVIDPNVHVEVLVRQTRPSGIDFNCKLQLEVNGQISSIEAFSFIYPQPLGALYVGGIPQNFAPHTSAPVVSGLVGCVRYLQVNSVEYFVYEDAVNGRNVRSCMVNDHCQYEPCRHNGTCVSLTADPAFTCCVRRVQRASLRAPDPFLLAQPLPCRGHLCAIGRTGILCLSLSLWKIWVNLQRK
ncbi:putative fibrillin-2 [Apostichopus japonicus]|uniref:Putative fibrillin-2 n=1 Tax=Stichopus japonicus TaxID=307972 RepID=A0A2G8LCZ4_STIJA|nr:putative fibrillin-2 [Apostichopus japonicus]